MSSLASDYTGNTVLIYTTNGDHLVSTVITEHDKHAKQIQLETFPTGLNVNDECKLMILSSPAPCEFNGKVKKTGASLFIGMFQGQERESRSATRYPVNTPALITAHLIDGTTHPIQNPLAVALINISTSGVRFRAAYYSLDVGDEFEMHLIINNNRKKVVAGVVNTLDNGTESSEYGCAFIVIE